MKTTEEDYMYMYVLVVGPSKHTAKYLKKLYYANMRVNGKEVKQQLDCSATVNILPEKM